MRSWISIALCSLMASYTVAENLSSADLSRARFAEAVIAVDRQENLCAEKRVTLPDDVFNDTGLTSEQLTHALSYFYFRSSVECVEKELGRFFIEAATLSLLSPDEMKDIQAGSELISFGPRKMIEAEAAYRQSIPSETRTRLESIEALQQPFHLFESSDALRQSANE